MDFSTAKAGDRLYSLIYGPVIIDTIYGDDPDYPLVGTVQGSPNNDFSTCSRCWTYDGRHNKNQLHPDLYWSRPGIIGGDTRPRQKEKRIVWVNFYLRGQTLSCGSVYVSEANAIRMSKGREYIGTYSVIIEVPL